MKGLVFDIKEFAIHDGGGIRTTVFLKGCPLRCVWCHNPEGLSAKPELSFKSARCLNCGLCRKGCSHPECQPFGRCLHICPEDLLSLVGEEWESSDLAERMLSYKPVFDSTGGGVTLSGGEPLLQADFCRELLSELRGNVHCAIETSGFADSESFRQVISLCDFVYMDLKLADRDKHKLYTGVDNSQILENLGWLRDSGIPYCIRTPLIPGITDTEENLSRIAALIGDSRWEKLPYNELAPAKYGNLGKEYPGDKYIKRKRTD